MSIESSVFGAATPGVIFVSNTGNDLLAAQGNPEFLKLNAISFEEGTGATEGASVYLPEDDVRRLRDLLGEWLVERTIRRLGAL